MRYLSEIIHKSDPIKGFYITAQQLNLLGALTIVHTKTIIFIPKSISVNSASPGSLFIGKRNTHSISFDEIHSHFK